jgi:hypothetical protein
MATRVLTSMLVKLLSHGMNIAPQKSFVPSFIRMELSIYELREYILRPGVKMCLLRSDFKHYQI